jgi:hypothetical protein
MNTNSVLEKNDTLANQSLINSRQTTSSNNFGIQEKAEYYFSDSEFYNIHGGFVAEVIQNPHFKILQAGLLEKVTQDLTAATLAAFGKTRDQKEEYAPKDVIWKHGIFVDWLTVVRDGSKVIAYSSSSYLNESQNLIYFNATMVDEAYQKISGLGSINHMYVIEKILRQRNDLESASLDFVTRSRNKGVARLLSSIMKYIKISGDDSLPQEDKSLFSNVAKLIDGVYDEATGICKNVYPKGLPTGVDKPDALGNMFLKLDECDGFFIYGKFNYHRICKYLAREVKPIGEVSKKPDTQLERLAA